MPAVKFHLFIALLLFAFTTHAQQDTTLTEGPCTYSFLQNNIEYDSCKVYQVHVNDSTRQWLVATGTFETHHGYGGPFGGGVMLTYTFNDVYDMTTGKKIFSAMNDYAYIENNCTGKTDSAGEAIDVVCITEDCSYHYAFTVNSNGSLTISNLHTSYKKSTEKNCNITTEKNTAHICLAAQPDFKTGTLYYKGNGFVGSEK